MILESIFPSPFPLSVVKFRPLIWPELLAQAFLRLFWKYPASRITVLKTQSASTLTPLQFYLPAFYMSLFTTSHPISVTRAFVPLRIQFLSQNCFLYVVNSYLSSKRQFNVPFSMKLFSNTQAGFNATRELFIPPFISSIMPHFGGLVFFFFIVPSLACNFIKGMYLTPVSTHSSQISDWNRISAQKC